MFCPFDSSATGDDSPLSPSRCEKDPLLRWSMKESDDRCVYPLFLVTSPSTMAVSIDDIQHDSTIPEI